MDPCMEETLYLFCGTRSDRISGGELKIAGCWAHNKRGFSKLCKALGKKAASGSIAEEAVRQIQAIYHVDNMMKDASPEAILQHRRNSVKPLVDAFFEWAKKIYPGVDKASETRRALTYSLHQEPYLRAFLDDPLSPLDHNDAERDGIRPFTVGRKNWVVIDSINGAEASAILYSIARTAVLNGLNPLIISNTYWTGCRAVCQENQMMLILMTCCPGHQRLRKSARN